MHLLLFLTSHSTVALVAQVSPAPDNDPISLQTAALIILGAAVIFCWKAIVELRRRLDELPTEAAARQLPPAPLQPRLAVPPVVDASPSPELIAVIAVAVHAAIKTRHRIVSVQPLPAEHHAWSIDGRRRIFESHKMR